MISSYLRFFFIAAFASLSFVSMPTLAQSWSVVTTSDGSTPTARHESNAIVYNGMIYFFGGRGQRPVDRYDPATNTWDTVAQPPLDPATQSPLEMHHFQPVLHNNKIYIIGAFSCCYPLEKIITDIHVFDPATLTWDIAGSIPAGRVRGSAAVVSHNNRIYVIGGNTNGHSGGAINWFDEYNPSTGNWTVLPDAPTSRDHFSAAVINNQLIATGGRQTQNSFAFTVAATDVFDFSSNQWVTTFDDIPTERAGTTAVVYNGQLIVIGGETVAGAHSTVEVFNPANNQWLALEDMINPRHAGGAVLLGSKLHVFGGSATRGGSGESDHHEVIDLSLAPTTGLPSKPADTDQDGLSDADEINIHMSDITLVDTDGDGISDFDEVHGTTTDPTKADTDGDDIDDLTEGTLNLDPNNPDTDNDGLEDGAEVNIHLTAADIEDTDMDGLTDGNEVNTIGSDPLLADTDNDGIADGTEVTEIGSSPLSLDTDSDGLSDADEYTIHGTSLISTDTDSDGLTDSDEINQHLSNALTSDTDNDSVSDYDEVVVHQSNPSSSDTDGDGVPDGQELASGSSLTNIDEDNDGLINSVDGTIDTDLDGLPNFADRDSDNDGIPDLIENGFTDANKDGQLDFVAASADSEPVAAASVISVAIDSDEDGVPDFIDLDSDQDGLPDLAEGVGDYTDSAISIMNMTDLNQDGLTDDYSNPAKIIPTDEDNDSIPSYLDLDSDDDGISDLVEAGVTDTDEDSKIDGFIDTDGDGLIDIGRPQLGGALPDEDNDSIPDIIDSEYTRKGLLGCTIATDMAANSSADPMFAALLLLALGSLHRRRKYAIRSDNR